MPYDTSIIDNWEDMAYKKRYFDLPKKISADKYAVTEF